jgi:glycosyltransferase involved in cell wall biosynthesis
VIITYIHSNQPEDELRVRLRCRNFADAINRIGWHSANLLDLDSFIQNTPEAQKICGASDLLVIHRYLYEPVFQSLEYWKARDKKVIVDFDQAINYLTPEIAGHSFWLEGESLANCGSVDKTYGNEIDSTPLEQLKWGLGLIDAAIVSSPRLMVDWSEFAHVHEIPDYLNTDQFPRFKQIHENEIWIGLGNGTRINSLKSSGLLNALENVCRERPQVKLILGDLGQAGSHLPDVQSSQLVSYLPNSFEEWSDILLNLDIGILPICGDDDLRLGRANLLEFMISKIPWLASNQLAFPELSRYGRLVQNSSEAWETAILKAVDNIEVLQKKASGEPFLFALSQDVNENIDKVLKLFTYILNQA